MPPSVVNVGLSIFFVGRLQSAYNIHLLVLCLSRTLFPPFSGAASLHAQLCSIGVQFRLVHDAKKIRERSLGYKTFKCLS